MTAPLREGYTTGTCAAAATLAAARYLVQGCISRSVLLLLPCGREAELPVAFVEATADGARAGVRKDAGDDPDITHESLIIAEVALSAGAPTAQAHSPSRSPCPAPLPHPPLKTRQCAAIPDSDFRAGADQGEAHMPPVTSSSCRSDDLGAGRPSGLLDDSGAEAQLALVGVSFVAGQGVGTVTRPGLQLAVGEPAINPVPRSQIARALRSVTPLPATVTISIPGGVALAAKTFNPRLGVVGGLSVIGTSGVVRPFSHEARRESVLCALRVAAAGFGNNANEAGRYDPTVGGGTLFLVPGHYGEAAARSFLGATPEQIVEVGNEWDCALPALAALGVGTVWLVGHPGKLAKFLAGQFQTHSASSDSALPVVVALAAELGVVRAYSGATVEGFFQACGAADARRVAEMLASRIAQATLPVLKKRGAQTQPLARVRVLLIDMQGHALGRC